MNTNTTHQTRTVLSWPALAVLAFVPLIVLAAGWQMLHDLPNEIAVHFDRSGRPDRSGESGPFISTVVWGTVIAALLTAVAGVVCRRRARSWPVGLVGLAGVGVAWLAPVIGLTTAAAHRNVKVWSEARLSLLPVLAYTGLYAAVIVVVMLKMLPIGPGEHQQTHGTVVRPAVVGPHERVMWVGNTHSPVILAVMVGVAAVSIGIGVGTSDPLLALLTGWGVIALATISQVHGRADHTGLTLRLGWAPWPRIRVPIDDIAEVSVADIKPAEWGGWGYRGSTTLTGRAALVLRRGDGLVITRHDGTLFAATLDGAADAAAVLETYRQQANPTGADS